MKKDEYLDITKDILKNEKFNNLKNEKHHYNSNRYEHSLKVSYYTYKVCKKLNLDYVSATKAALLHDFFFDSEFINNKDKILNHYRASIANSSMIINLSKKEKNIIESHMYPVGGKLPRYKESIVVDLIDDYVSIKEKFWGDYKYVNVALNFLLIILINYILK